jgi:hypothetical protein
MEALDAFVPRFPSDEGDWEAILESASGLAITDVASVPKRDRLSRGLEGARLLLVATIATVALAAVGIAIAAGFDAFSGISAAEHPPTSADTLDPQTRSDLRQACPTGVQSAGYIATCNLALDSARRVGQLTTGQKIYVMTDTHSDLCVIVQSFTVSCGAALDSEHPTTEVTGTGGGGDFVAYGVARNDVASVSFSVAGHDVTVPVKNNVWAYEDSSSGSAASCITVHHTDGSTLVPFPDTC